jgi:hypothetical protein
LSDMKVVEFNFWNIAILQQEILNVKKILDERIDKILEIIWDLEKEKYVKSFISFVDIWEKCNYFVCIDKELQEILEKVLDVKFENSIAKKEWILMRKEIIALMK